VIGLKIVDLAFFAARGYGHAYASASVGATGGSVPALFIGIEQVTVFTVDQADARDQRAHIPVNIEPDFLHVLVEMTPTGGGRQFGQWGPDIQVRGGMPIIQEAGTGAVRRAIFVNIEKRHIECVVAASGS